MFVPVALCPGSVPLARSASIKDVRLTLHNTDPVTLHVSSIGNGVRPGRYMTLRGLSTTVCEPKQLLDYSKLKCIQCTYSVQMLCVMHIYLVVPQKLRDRSRKLLYTLCATI